MTFVHPGFIPATANHYSMHSSLKTPLLMLACLLPGSIALAQNASITAGRIYRSPAPAGVQSFGNASKGPKLEVGDRSLLLNDKAFWPVVAKFNFSALPENSWREEMLKLKAAGIDMLSIELAWGTHEQTEGLYSWAGQKNLPKVIDLCRDLELKVLLCAGPGLPENAKAGGIPSWLKEKDLRVRTNDEAYLKHVRRWYAELAKQLKGRLWKEGGPIVAVQLENDYSGPGQHLTTLKSLARSQGLDVPFYVYSGSAKLSSSLPPGELVSFPQTVSGDLWNSESMPVDNQVTILSSGLQAPLVRPDFFQRRLHLFLNEFGDQLAKMDTYLPPSDTVLKVSPGKPAWYLRSNGTAAFVLVNTTGATSSAELNFSMELFGCEDPVVMPESPVAIPASTKTIWPVNLPITEKITLGYATAMPLCVLDDHGIRTIFLAATRGVPTEIGVSSDRGVVTTPLKGRSSGIKKGNEVFQDLQPSREPLLEIKAPGSMLVRVVVLSEADSLNLLRVRWLDEERVIIWNGLVMQDGDQIDLYDEVGRKTRGSLLVYPNPSELIVASQKVVGKREGVFTSYEIGSRKQTVAKAP